MAFVHNYSNTLSLFLNYLMKQYDNFHFEIWNIWQQNYHLLALLNIFNSSKFHIKTSLVVIIISYFIVKYTYSPWEVAFQR